MTIDLPKVPEVPDVIDINWDAEVHGVKIYLAPTDELGFPIAKRGTHLPVPTDFRSHREFAKRVGTLVEETMKAILAVPEEVARESA